MPWPIAFSFPCWRCAGCRNIVEWEDAVCEEEGGRLVAIRHKDCTDG